jgi:hypothetical protein
MPELRRFENHKMILKASAVLLVLMAVGAVLLFAMSSGSGADPAGAQSDEVPAAPTSSPPARASGGHSSHPGTSNDGSSGGAVVTHPDPDKPVSSEDPPAPTRPAPSPPDDGIDSFEDCAAAGYPIAESYPEQCFTPDGRSFTRSIP